MLHILLIFRWRLHICRQRKQRRRRLATANTPQQNNGTDCGVFMCSFAECVASGQELTFRQTDVRDQREHLGVSILEGRIRGWRGWEG